MAMLGLDGRPGGSRSPGPREASVLERQVSHSLRLLVADDHPLFREGMRALVGAHDITVVAEAGTGPDAIAMAARHHPDIVLLDLSMPGGLSGPEIVTAIKQRSPGSRVVVVTGFGGEEDVYQALRSHASGFVLKDATGDELIECIRRVTAGQVYLSPSAASRLSARLSGPELTPRERDVLQLVVAGCSNKEIAARLKIAEGTIKAHVNRILQKLGARSRAEAITTAIRRGHVRVEPHDGEKRSRS